MKHLPLTSLHFMTSAGKKCMHYSESTGQSCASFMKPTEGFVSCVLFSYETYLGNVVRKQWTSLRIFGGRKT